MGSSVYVDGFALWVLLILAGALITGVIFFGCAYIAEARENDRLKHENRQLCIMLKRVADKRYKLNFTVPEVDENV